MKTGPLHDTNEFLSNYVSNDSFKKLIDNVTILTSTLPSKLYSDDFENTLKKMDILLEKIEMSAIGLAFESKPKINLELDNTAINKENFEIPS